MDYDVAARNNRRRNDILWDTLLAIVDGFAICRVPDPDPEVVFAASALSLTINGGHEEAIIEATHGPITSPIGPGTGNHQPLVVCTLELDGGGRVDGRDVGRVETELCSAGWHCGTLLVLGNKCELSLPGQVVNIRMNVGAGR